MSPELSDTFRKNSTGSVDRVTITIAPETFSKVLEDVGLVALGGQDFHNIIVRRDGDLFSRCFLSSYIAPPFRFIVYPDKTGTLNGWLYPSCRGLAILNFYPFSPHQY